MVACNRGKIMQKCKKMVQRELAHSGPFFYIFIGRQPDSEMQRSGKVSPQGEKVPWGKSNWHAL